MKKITATILIALILILSLSACSSEKSNSFLSKVTLGLWDRIILDEKTHNVVEYIDQDTRRYQDNTYYLAPMIFFQDSSTTVQEKRGYEYIGWSGPRFFYIDTFYGDSKDSPSILYESRLSATYFREDYDYKTDTFKIEETDDAVCFAEDLTELSGVPSSDGAYTSKVYIVLSSSTHPSLDIRLGVFEEDGIWYAYSMDFVYFELSENLVEILMKNGIIPYPDYKDAYLSFLKSKKESHTSFSLVFIDDDDIPELYLRGVSEAEGDIVCSFKNGAVVEQRLGRTGGGRYIERSGKMINQNGHMDRYYDVVYNLDGNGFSTVLNGRYEESYAHIGDDGRIDIHRDYFIDDAPVSEAEYNKALLSAFDISKAVRLDENAVSYEAIVQKLGGSPEGSTVGAKG